MRIPTFFLALLSLGFLAGGSAAALGVNTSGNLSRTDAPRVRVVQVSEAQSDKADSQKESSEDGTDQGSDQSQSGDQTDSGHDN